MREHDQDAGQTARTLDRLTGAILDRRYRIDEKLAAGGFGAIYRATDLVMGREVALKVLHRELAHDASVVERFRREAGALAKLRDPHTITMYDVGESEDGTRYIVMELLRGESLYEQFHAHGKRLPWRRIAHIARGVCSSLREAHAVGIVHRDIKPANIHLEKHALEDDFVKVLDFGIAKLVDASEPNRNLTLAGQMIGTFDYMPPEQMIGGMCTGKSDVFTLAVVIYEMIGGERPYGHARGPASMLMTLLGTTPVPLAERVAVPLALDRIVMRALQRDPDERPDITEFDDELARILDNSFDEDEAKFTDEDGPTWLEPPTLPVRRTTPTNLRPTPNSLRPPFKASAPTMIGTVAPVTPSRGLTVLPPILPAVMPKRPAPPPTKPSDFAVGSATQIPPVPPTAQQRVAAGTSPVGNVVAAPAPMGNVAAPAPMGNVAAPAPVGNVAAPAPVAPATSYDLARMQSRDAVVRGVVYALLTAIVAVSIYLMY